MNLETTKQEFRDIIFLEIKQVLQSRKKVNSLKEILSKTDISIIKPNIWEKSYNLINYSREKFSKECDANISDMIFLDNIIQTLENTIDTMIFQIYQLTKSEVSIVLEVLGVLNSSKNKILHNFQS